MKKCNDCNVEMIENTNLHTDYDDEKNGSKMLFSNKNIQKKN